MGFTVAETVSIVVVIIFGVLCAGYLVMFKTSHVKQISEEKSIKQVLESDSHYNRLLMVEILSEPKHQNPKPETGKMWSETTESSSPYEGGFFAKGDKTTLSRDKDSSPLVFLEKTKHAQEEDHHPKRQDITSSKMTSGAVLLGRILSSHIGTITSQKIATLMNRRNEILRNYYVHLSNESSCDALQGTHNSFMLGEGKDVHLLTQRNLESISREITDSLASVAMTGEEDQTSYEKRPVARFQKLHNFICMYDKELINQARSYSVCRYDISINCSQSTMDISSKIGEELSHILREIK